MISHTMCRLDSGEHKQVTVHVGKIQLIPGRLEQLSEKYALGSTVSLPEGMEFIGRAVEVGKFFYQLFSLQPPEGNRGSSSVQK